MIKMQIKQFPAFFKIDVDKYMKLVRLKPTLTFIFLIAEERDLLILTETFCNA